MGFFHATNHGGGAQSARGLLLTIGRLEHNIAMKLGTVMH